MGKNKKNVGYSNKQYKEALCLNDECVNHYYMALRQLCLSMFEWELPESMDARKLEIDLFNKGAAASLQTETMGIINTQVSTGDYINIYGIPTRLECWSYDFNEVRTLYSGILRDENGNMINEPTEQAILIMNNLDRYPTSIICEFYAYRLANAQRTIDVNVNGLKTPLMLICSENELLTLRNAYAQYNGNEPVLYADKNSNINLDSIKAVKTDVPYNVDKLVDYKKEIWNEFLTRMGINNIQTEKKERLIKDEANQNNEVINLNLQYFFKTRKRSCEQMNELFGINASVKISSDLYNIIKQTESVVTGKINEELTNEIKEGVTNE